jgi:NADPH:quinone reductase-like Zn-dependent oxidoreductase
VVTATSAVNRDYVHDLGANEIIDYNAHDFVLIGPTYDAVFDTVGGDVAECSFTVLKSGGRAAFIASSAQAPKPDRSDETSLRPAVGRLRAALASSRSIAPALFARLRSRSIALPKWPTRTA